MTHAMPAHFAESDFRVGRVLSRTISVLSQHFLIFCVVTLVANAPVILLVQNAVKSDPANPSLGLLFLGIGLSFVLSILSQAVLVHASFQAMRNRAVNLGESLRVGFAVLPRARGCIARRHSGWPRLHAPHRSGFDPDDDVADCTSGLCRGAERPVDQHAPKL